MSAFHFEDGGDVEYTGTATETFNLAGDTSGRVYVVGCRPVEDIEINKRVSKKKGNRKKDWHR